VKSIRWILLTTGTIIVLAWALPLCFADRDSGDSAGASVEAPAASDRAAPDRAASDRTAGPVDQRLADGVADRAADRSDGASDSADDSSGEPVRPRRRRGPGTDGPAFLGRGWGRSNNSALDGPVAPETWTKVSAFMKINSPRRFELFQQDVTDQAHKERLKQSMAARYKWLEDLKARDPALYELRVKRITIEDQIFGLGYDLRHGEGEASKIHDKLRAQVSSLFDNRVSEHRLLLSQLEQKVSAEKKRLEALQGREDELIKQGVAALEDDHPPGDIFGSVFAPPGRDRLRDRRSAPGSSAADSATSPAVPDD
jgi:hypothetical protein